MTNEFTEMIKEAFVGEEPYESSPGREALLASIRSFEARDRTMRLLVWFVVTFMAALAAWAGWKFASESSTKMLILYATVFLWGMQGVGWAKMFLFSTQKSLSMLKELKRVQLTILDARRE